MTKLRPGVSHAAMRGRAMLLASCLLPACSFLRSPGIPMGMVLDRAPATRGPRVLLVILPGVGDTPADLVRHGMVAMVRDRRIAADVIVADAHFGYYRARQTVQRLWQDIIEPTRSQGYDAVWLAGVSIGGLGALLYGSGVESSEPAPVAGILAIAPWIGGDEVLDEVAAAGGLRAWQPAPSATDYSRRLLGWLRGYGDPAAARPKLYLGVGSEDKLRRHAQLVMPILSADHVIEIPGTHAWPPWLVIWAQMLDRAPLPRLLP